ncbi:MAG: peptidoglycan DD-metalloendopeptidase family protein [Cyanobacteria bacterium P01_G01_bin.38]
MESQAVRQTVIGAMTLAATYSVLGIETAQAKDGLNVDPVPAVKPTAQPNAAPVGPAVPTIAPPETARQPVFTQPAASAEAAANSRLIAPSLRRLQETRLNSIPINREAIFKSSPSPTDHSIRSGPPSSQVENLTAPDPSAELDGPAEPLKNPAAGRLLPTAPAEPGERSDRAMQFDSTGITQRFVAPARVTLSQSTPVLTHDLVAAGAMAEADLPTQYQVQKGDTLHKIANSLGVAIEELVEANDIADPNRIIAGIDLVLPTSAAEGVPGAEAVEGGIDEKAVLETAVETTDVNPSVETSSVLSEQSVPSEQQLSSATPQDRLARLQATVSRPVDSVMLLSQLQGTPLPLGPDQATALDAPTVAAPSAIEETAIEETAKDAAADLEVAEPQPVIGEQTPEPPDVYLASLLDSVSDASTSYTAAQVAEPVEVTSASVEQSTETLLAVAPLDNAEWIRRQAPRAGDPVEATTPLLPGAHEYLPQPSDAFNGYVWPTHGTLTSGYGWRWGRLHRGVDIAAPVGTPVMAAAPGVVEYAQWNSGGYGNLVDIRHADGSLTRYAHNNRLVVRAGQRVQQGQLIAEMGSTGRSTGPHLHFEIHPANSGATNPMALLPARR